MTDDEYADVRTLIRDRTSTPPHRVDVDEVIRRGRRSRRIRRADQALAVGAVLAVVVAAGVLVSRPHESTPPVGPSPSASTIALPTSDWKPGDDANLALASGTLTLDDRGCVVVDRGRGVLTAVVWPSGTTGRRSSGGAVQVVAPDGSVAASTGDHVAVGGGFGGSGSTDPCVAAYREAFTVMQPPPYNADITTPKAVLDAIASAKMKGTVRGPVQWVESTTKGAADLTSTGPGAADVAIYIVQIEGDFELRTVFSPGGGPGHPRGTVLRTFIPVHDTGQGGGGGSLTSTTADLSAYGPVHYVYP